jgi:hypothetical protein
MFGGVMKDVDLPETEQDFPCKELAIDLSHRINCKRLRRAAQGFER